MHSDNQPYPFQPQRQGIPEVVHRNENKVSPLHPTCLVQPPPCRSFKLQRHRPMLTVRVPGLKVLIGIKMLPPARETPHCCWFQLHDLTDVPAAPDWANASDAKINCTTKKKMQTLHEWSRAASPSKVGTSEIVQTHLRPVYLDEKIWKPPRFSFIKAA